MQPAALAQGMDAVQEELPSVVLGTTNAADVKAEANSDWLHADARVEVRN